MRVLRTIKFVSKKELADIKAHNANKSEYAKSITEDDNGVLTLNLCKETYEEIIKRREEENE